MLLGELDLLAGDFVNPLLLGPIRLNDEPDLGSSRAADVANHVVELLLDQIDDFSVFLLDPDDFVFGLKPAVPVGRHVGDDLGHDGEAVFRPE